MKQIILVLIGLWVSSFLMAQSLTSNLGNTLKLADKHYNNYSFKQAAELYEVALKKETNDPTIKLKLAESYRHLNDPKHAAQWYSEVVDNDQVTQPIHKLYYAQSLSSNGEYEEAKKWYQEYHDVAGSDERATNKIEGIEHIDQFFKFQEMYDVEAVAVNSKDADFSPAFYDQGVVFASARGTEAWRKNTFSWNNKSFLDLYYSRETESGELLEPTKFSEDINSKLHEGPTVFFDQGKKVIFTRNNIKAGKISKSQDKLVKLKLFYAEWSDERSKWVRLKELPFNSDEYSVGHPAISDDGTRLYFASDMPGGFGGTDLYSSNYVNGSWGTPVNLGSSVNTKGDEMFPFLHQDEVIFFASNGHEGLGGLDIYSSNLEGTTAGEPVNLGAPINGAKDDFSLILDQSNRFGYFSSNRNGESEDDDIFRFVVDQIPIEGQLVNSETGGLLEDTNIKVLNKETGELVPFTREKDKITFLGSPGTEYQVLTKGGKLDDAAVISAQSIPPDLRKLSVGVPLIVENTRNLAAVDKVDVIIIQGTGRSQSFVGAGGKLHEEENLEVLYASIEKEGITIDRKFVIKNIYYNFDRHEIRDDAQPQLDNIVEVLNAYPTTIIALAAHTDSRGSSIYNRRLAERRANAAMAYLADKGISRNRIVAKWLGEDKLVNRCEDGTDCDSKQHQNNRRTEFEIIIK